MTDPHDWEADPRPYAEVVMAWAKRRNGGKVHGARQLAINELRYDRPSTFKGHMAGRPCPQERTYRRLMTLIDRQS